MPFTKNGMFKLTKCGLSPQGFSILCSVTWIEWFKGITAAVTGSCIFGDATTFINKDCRVLFGDISIVPLLGPALEYLTAMHVQPGVGTFGCI